MENVNIIIVDKNFEVQNLQGLIIRNEENANTIKIQFPKTYEGEDLTGKMFILKCTNANGVYFETLLGKAIKETYIELTWTVTAEFTTVSGTLKVAIFAESANYSLGTKMSKVIVEESPQITIPIDDLTVLESYMTEIRIAAVQVERDRAEALDSKDIAVTARDEAVIARNEAVPASVTAVDAKNIAVTARDEAEAARDAAAASQEGALTSKNAAAASQSAAETARTGADAAKTEALASKLAAETAKTEAEAARDIAVTARDEAVAARDEAVPASVTAVDAKNIAVTARDEAVIARDIAVTAADDAVVRMQAFEPGAIAVQVENLSYRNAGAHNSIYRGKFLGTSVTTAQYSAISSGTFDDLYIGDYWRIGGINYRIAGFNYFYNVGDVSLTQNHVTIVPDTQLASARMNPTNDTTGGYALSEMRTTNLATATATIESAFAGHVITHRQILTNAVTTGKASGWAWFDCKVELMSEVMLYGSVAWGEATYNSGYNVGSTNGQLPLFALRRDLINIRQNYWLRDVVSATLFAFAIYYGSASYGSASISYGVRPFFSIG